MKKMLESLREASRQAIEEAVDMDSLEVLRVRYLGKKGELTAILKQMGKLSAEERPGDRPACERGPQPSMENEIESRKSALARARLQEAKLRAETLDVTMPGKEMLARQEARYEHRARRSRLIYSSAWALPSSTARRSSLPTTTLTRLNIPENHTVREWTGYVLYHRGRAGPCSAARPPRCRSARWRTSRPPIRILSPGPRVPQGRGRRDPFPDVPPDRGSCHRQGHHDGRSQGHAQHPDEKALRSTIP